MTSLFWFGLGLFLAAVVVWVRRRLGSFAGQKSEQYADEFPELDLRRHFAQDLVCEGVIFGPFGRMTSSFRADFRPRWEGNTLVLTEYFLYNDQTEQTREWTLIMGKNGCFSGTAPDVIGRCKGKQAGSALRLRYAIRLPERHGGHVLKALDWMYMTPDGTIVNRSQFRKYGFKVAELVGTIRPKEPS
jgi:hypothetical protein